SRPWHACSPLRWRCVCVELEGHLLRARGPRVLHGPVRCHALHLLFPSAAGERELEALDRLCRHDLVHVYCPPDLYLDGGRTGVLSLFLLSPRGAAPRLFRAFTTPPGRFAPAAPAAGANHPSHGKLTSGFRQRIPQADTRRVCAPGYMARTRPGGHAGLVEHSA